MNPIKTLVSTEQLAELAGIKPGSIAGLITRGTIPQPDAKVGKSSVWHIDTVTEWLDRRPGPGNAWADTLPAGNPEKAAEALSQWVTVKDIAEALETSPRNVTDRVARGTFPQPAGRIGRTLLWPKECLNA
ncbi:hypothetical protein [Stomatohabitans albus]|uniref:helix-turn-helix transcriptional regulator n=1 Tax=Stomatohabitans albus TaxID=3110766 RepID=UPI00300C11B6